ncbi:hypothetical protein M0R89_18595 (plasmid) [Halorussus limi]|uniref:Uncharacterized protein n=1 Tax=Halorussus limi TaxID=2938695 RepID=A0A8U0HZG7_9EURY|nr:hypothetical protein [Halorussus limi]UPV76542.1 hypothetical protein M0R89_18595 [Halorussus limi]
MLPDAAVLTPLDAGHGGSPDLAFVALLALAGLGSAVVLGLALAALLRRRSRSYLLVTLALATLLARTGVAALSLTGALAAGSHHLLEHGLDAAMAALVVAAVYDARRVRRTADRRDDSQSLRSDGGEVPGRDGRVERGESARRGGGDR